MEIRTLRYFLMTAREENMTRAAELLHVTQPTLSKAMKSLEDELGRKLFTRHSFSIRLTEEGRLLRSRAEDLVSMADKIEQEFVSLDDITGGDIFFGLAESYQIRYLAREIRAFRRQYPEVHYHITSGDTEQVTEKLDKGILDFAVLAETPDVTKYDALVFPDADVLFRLRGLKTMLPLLSIEEGKVFEELRKQKLHAKEILKSFLRIARAMQDGQEEAKLCELIYEEDLPASFLLAMISSFEEDKLRRMRIYSGLAEKYATSGQMDRVMIYAQVAMQEGRKLGTQ